MTLSSSSLSSVNRTLTWRARLSARKLREKRSTGLSTTWLMVGVGIVSPGSHLTNLGVEHKKAQEVLSGQIEEAQIQTQESREEAEVGTSQYRDRLSLSCSLCRKPRRVSSLCAMTTMKNWQSMSGVILSSHFPYHHGFSQLQLRKDVSHPVRWTVWKHTGNR